MAMKLLIVEDDVSLQQMLTWDFQDLGYDVTAVTSCARAREKFTGHNFDLALVDYHLPDGNGVDLLQEMRARCPAMQIVMSSGLACAETACKAVRDHGAFKFVPKPAAADHLHKVFQAALAETGGED